MAFRDDRDALRARADAASREAEELRDELERAKRDLQAHESKDEHDEKELAELRRKVARLEGKRPPGDASQTNRGGFIAVGAAAVFFLVVGAVTYTTSSETMEAAAPPKPAVAVPTPPEPQPEPPPTAVGPAPNDVAVWPALVARSEGDGPAVGTGCAVVGALTRGPDFRDLEIHCGPEPLYRSGMSGGAEMTMHESSLRSLVAAGDHGYEVFEGATYQDVGTRSGPRPQVRFESSERRLRVWREVGERFDLTLLVDARSAPRIGEPLGPEVPWVGDALSPRRVRMRRTARRGDVPVDVSECELSIVPTIFPAAGARGGAPCRALFHCEGEVLYGRGNSGYNACAHPLAIDDTNPSSVDTDPVFSFDAERGEVRLRDDDPEWSMRFERVDGEVCSLDGFWSGVEYGLDGALPGLLLTDTGVLIRPASPLAATSVTTEIDCDEGRAVLEAEGLRLEGRFGPGFQTLTGLGEVEGERRMFWLRRQDASESLSNAQVQTRVQVTGTTTQVRVEVRTP